MKEFVLKIQNLQNIQRTQSSVKIGQPITTKHEDEFGR